MTYNNEETKIIQKQQGRNRCKNLTPGPQKQIYPEVSKIH